MTNILTKEKLEKIKLQKIGFFRFKKFDSNSFLITNDVGEFCFLSNEEFGNFISGELEKIDLKKRKELEEKSFIKDEKYKEKLIPKVFEKNSFLKQGPTLHIIVTTLRCNHKCKYCHAAVAPMTAKKMDMSIDIAKKVVDTIFYSPSNDLTIEFQGGESLVNWKVVKFIIEYSKSKAELLKKKIHFALVSNLTLMDDEKLDYLLNNNVSISTSLDGNELIHNYNRTFKEGNSYKLVTKWIKKINKEYKKRGLNKKVGALLTVTKKTLDKYKEVIDEYVNLGLDGIFLRPMNPYGFAEVELKTLGYSWKDFFEFYKNSMDYILELNKKGIFFSEYMSSVYLNKILTKKDPNFLDERSPCGACVGQVAYNYDGRIYSCDEGRMLARTGEQLFKMSDLGEGGKETYLNMINSDTTKVMIQRSTLDSLPGYNESVYKTYLGVCPIHSYKKTGNIISNYIIDDRRRLGESILDYLFKQIKNGSNNDVFNKWLNTEKGNKISCEIF